jgi:hypothetical protein
VRRNDARWKRKIGDVPFVLGRCSLRWSQQVSLSTFSSWEFLAPGTCRHTEIISSGAGSTTSILYEDYGLSYSLRASSYTTAFRRFTRPENKVSAPCCLLANAGFREKILRFISYFLPLDWKRISTWRRASTFVKFELFWPYAPIVWVQIESYRVIVCVSRIPYRSCAVASS